MKNEMMDNQINILIVDDHQLVREGMRMLLEKEADFSVKGDVGNLATAMALLGKEEVDLVIMDYSLKEEKGDANTKIILEAHPHLKVLATTSFGDRGTIEAMLRAGATGYVLKGTGKEDFLRAVRETAAGRTHLDSDVTETLLQELLPGGNKPKPVSKDLIDLVDLTPREKEVLVLIAQEQTTKEIGEQLHISPKTVENHRINLMQKTGARNLAGLVKYAIKAGFIE